MQVRPVGLLMAGFFLDFTGGILISRAHGQVRSIAPGLAAWEQVYSTVNVTSPTWCEARRAKACPD